MPQKRLAILTLLIVLLSMTPTLVHSYTPASPAKITIVTTPEPYLNQLTSGDRCIFQVTVQNLGVDVQEGQVVNASIPDVKYSGNFTLETTFELRKQGRLSYNGQSVSYITSLNNTQIDNYYSLKIPSINGTLSEVVTYNLTKGYEAFGVRPDEDMVLYLRVNLFVQTYRDVNGTYQLQVGVKINTHRNDYYIQDFVKREYLAGKFLDIKSEIGQLKNINSAQVQIGKDYFNNIVGSINATMTRGDYVNALQLILNYYQFDQPKLVALLYTNLNSTGIAADSYVKLKQDYSNLNGQYNVLLQDFDQALKLNQLQQENITQLEAKAQSDRQSFIIQSLTGIVVLFFIGLLFGSRFHLFR
jgi:hypothetical protein